MNDIKSIILPRQSKLQRSLLFRLNQKTCLSSPPYMTENSLQKAFSVQPQMLITWRPKNWHHFIQCYYIWQASTWQLASLPPYLFLHLVWPYSTWYWVTYLKHSCSNYSLSIASSFLCSQDPISSSDAQTLIECKGLGTFIGIEGSSWMNVSRSFSISCVWCYYDSYKSFSLTNWLNDHVYF